MTAAHERIVKEIADERKRQREKEYWSNDHDDAQTDGSLAQAAACYAWPNKSTRCETREVRAYRGNELEVFKCPRNWPKSWWAGWWKPKDRRRDLIRAAALIVAEIERLDRAQAKEIVK